MDEESFLKEIKLIRDDIKLIQIDIGKIWKEFEYTNRTNADLRQQVAVLKSQALTTYITPEKNVRTLRLETIWHEVKLKGSLDYRDIMILLHLKHKMTAYRLMEQAEDLYPTDLIVRPSIQNKKVRLIWKGE